MKSLSWDVCVGPHEAIVVTLDHAAKVFLLDDSNFSNYRRRCSFRYFGGYYNRSPVVLYPPRSGRWHVVVDAGGSGASVRASVQLVQDAA